VNFKTFQSRSEASIAAADHIGQGITHALAAQRRATIAVSGGTTPVKCFESLRRRALDWQRVTVTLTDERCVAVEHEDSNTRLVREHLLLEAAAQARFLPLEPQALNESRAPFATCLLGMGEDGHFASLFPDADNLNQALNLDGEADCISIATRASPHARISLTLARILRSEQLCLLVFGDKKRAVIEQPTGTPIAHLLTQETTPLTVYWAN